IPAWVLVDNLYTARRSEVKYRARNQARRSELQLEVFRPSIIELMRDAVLRLESVAEPKEVYTERDIAGLGKNYLLEEHRLGAIEAYLFFIHYYALLGLKQRLTGLLSERQSLRGNQLPPAGPEDGPWKHQRRILEEEFGHACAVSALRLLPAMLEKV